MKTRIISGAVALLLLVIIILLRGTVVFNIGFGLVGALMAYELYRAEKLEKEYALLLPSVIFALVWPILTYFVPSGRLFAEIGVEGDPSSAQKLAFTAFLYIIAAFAYIVIITTVLLFHHKTVSGGKFYLCALYTLLIAACMGSLCDIVRFFGDASVLCLALTFMGSWVADSGAYFAGTLFGKHKLCPSISPKKTVEGLIGGAVTNAAVFAIFAAVVNALRNDISMNIPFYAAIGVICCLLGLLGDLTASLIKRECEIKDFGNIMPGHGGAMDRFDSVVYVAPFMLLTFVSVG